MIKIIKLATGEELMGDIDEEYNIKDPCILQMVPSRNDPTKASMALIPYATYVSGGKLEISPEHIIWEGEPVDEIYNHYNSIFGSGIQLPNSKLR